VQTATPATARQPAIDALRGLVMIIMALDHVRDFFHRQAMSFQPEDLAHTTPAIFFTRWVTHFCAPVFMATAGVAAFYWLQRGRTTGELSSFLWKRGFWLIVLELTVLRFAMFFSLTSGPVLLTVLWGLGWSMVLLGLLVHLPVRVLATISIAGILLHNLADPVQAARFGSFAWLWDVLHQNGAFGVVGIIVVVGYPLIPWFAVMAAGFCFGSVMNLSPKRRQRIMLQLGSAMVIAFLVLRAINKYGDPRPWTQTDSITTVLSFLRVNKYPPSLDYLLVTLGPALLLLAVFDKCKFGMLNPLLVFGRTPLFFFLAHFLAAHLLAFPLAAIRYGRIAFLLHPLPSMGGNAKLYPAGYGYSLCGVYLIWIAVVVMLYPLCVWFSRVKQEKNFWWLLYL
jgi:uncharacterized membrane protein